MFVKNDKIIDAESQEFFNPLKMVDDPHRTPVVVVVVRPMLTNALIFFVKGSCDSLLSRIKRQQSTTAGETKKEESFEIEICKDKDAGEWFRLTGQEGDSCRDVIQCTSSVNMLTRRVTQPDDIFL